MKKSLVMASLVVASTSMMAMDLQYFLGAGANRVDADVKGTLDYSISGQTGGFSGTESFKDTGLLLKTGVILDKTHRISLSHINYGIDDGGDFRIILGNYDYLIPVNENFRFLAGLHLGHANYETDDDFKMSGLAYGAQVGAIYDITKNIEFELGLAFTKYNVDKSTNGTILGLDYTEKVELEDSTSMFAGINYKF